MHPVFEEDQKQKSSSAFRLWKEQKEDRKRASSRSLSGGKIIHLFHEINRSNIFNHWDAINSYYILYFEIKDSNKCPDGYVFGLQGDVPQAGLISLSTGRNIPANRERCAEICNHNSRCKSFFFSPTVGQCKISSELIPTDRPYRDWIMCTKSGLYKICIVLCSSLILLNISSIHSSWMILIWFDKLSRCNLQSRIHL